MKYKAVIFDLDGTLIDTLEDLANAMNRVLESYHAPPHSLKSYRYFIGKGLRHFINKALPKELLTEAIIKDCILKFNEEYESNWNVKTHLYEGISEMLNQLKDKDIRMAILSNKPHIFIHKCVNSMLTHWKFEQVFGQQAGLPIKPDATVALKISKQMNIPCQKFIFVGDTAVDIQTAKNALMGSVGVTWGFRTADDLRLEKPDYLFDHPSQISSLF